MPVLFPSSLIVLGSYRSIFLGRELAPMVVAFAMEHLSPWAQTVFSYCPIEITLLPAHESTSSTCWTTFPPSSLELTTCSWPLTHHCPCREDTTSVISQVYWLSRREAPAILCSKCQWFWEPSHLSMHIKQHGQVGEGTGRYGGEANVEARRCGLGSRLSYLLAVKTELIIKPQSLGSFFYERIIPSLQSFCGN